MRYLLTYFKEDGNGYVDEFHMVFEKEHTAKKAYNQIASEENTISIELEEL